MKHYYLDGVEITPEAAKKVIDTTNRAFELAEKTGDIRYMVNCRFVMIIEKNDQAEADNQKA